MFSVSSSSSHVEVEPSSGKSSASARLSSSSNRKSARLARSCASRVLIRDGKLIAREVDGKLRLIEKRSPSEVHQMDELGPQSDPAARTGYIWTDECCFQCRVDMFCALIVRTASLCFQKKVKHLRKMRISPHAGEAFSICV